MRKSKSLKENEFYLEEYFNEVWEDKDIINDNACISSLFCTLKLEEVKVKHKKEVMKELQTE